MQAEEKDEEEGRGSETFSRHSRENTLVTQSWSEQKNGLLQGVGDRVVQ